MVQQICLALALLIAAVSAQAKLMSEEQLRAFSTQNGYHVANPKGASTFQAEKNCCDKGAYSIIMGFSDFKGMKQVGLWINDCNSQTITEGQRKLGDEELTKLYKALTDKELPAALTEYVKTFHGESITVSTADFKKIRLSDRFIKSDYGSARSLRVDFF